MTDGLVLVAASDQVGAVLRRLPDDRNQRAFSYVVFPAAAGSYHVLQWQQIEQIAGDDGHKLLVAAIGDLVGLPAPVPAVEVDSMSMRAATDLRNDQRPLRVLVVLRSGAFIGLLLNNPRGDLVLGHDPFAHTASAKPPFVPPPVPEATPRPGADTNESALVLGDDEAAPPAPELAPAPATDDRVINAWIDDDAVRGGAALQANESYELKFSVESPRKDVISTAAIDTTALFAGLPETVKQVEITVVLDSDDFEILGAQQDTIVLPRQGKSRKNANFTISARQNGVGQIRALFFASGQLFQKMKLTLQVGAVAPQAPVISVAATGKTLASAFVSARQPQHVDLVISRKDAGYEFILQSGGFKRATVNLSELQIADMVLAARDALKQIVYAKDGATFAYQKPDTSIPASIHAQSLKALAGIGVDLFNGVFFATGASEDIKQIGRTLRDRSRAAQLRIAIVAERFAFPWALLYDRDYDPNAVDPEGFWGFKHVIEYTPEFTALNPVNFVPEITVDATLEMAFVLNNTIDAELLRKGATTKVIEPQQNFLKTLAGVTVTEYPNSSDLFRLLRDTAGKTQLIYFYCHAESAQPGVAGGIDASKVVLSDGPVTLNDLKRAVPNDGPSMQSCPLVFLNACESAELSPLLYDGLVPFLISRGARGVLGTEVNTPALFAAEFAQAFLTRFLAGDQPLGDLLLQMRRDYRDTKNNLMGLVYALHSGADVVVRRG